MPIVRGRETRKGVIGGEEGGVGVRVGGGVGGGGVCDVVGEVRRGVGGVG